jgi:hypothetical protein
LYTLYRGQDGAWSSLFTLLDSLGWGYLRRIFILAAVLWRGGCCWFLVGETSFLRGIWRTGLLQSTRLWWRGRCLLQGIRPLLRFSVRGAGRARYETCIRTRAPFLFFLGRRRDWGETFCFSRFGNGSRVHPFAGLFLGDRRCVARCSIFRLNRLLRYRDVKPHRHRVRHYH